MGTKGAPCPPRLTSKVLKSYTTFFFNFWAIICPSPICLVNPFFGSWKIVWPWEEIKSTESLFLCINWCVISARYLPYSRSICLIKRGSFLCKFWSKSVPLLSTQRILTRCYTSTTTYTSSSIECHISILFWHRDCISIYCISRGINRYITSGLNNSVKSWAIHY